VPAELTAVLQRLMQKAPENRYGSAAEVVEALRPLASGAPAAPRPAARPAAPRPASRPAPAAPVPVAPEPPGAPPRPSPPPGPPAPPPRPAPAGPRPPRRARRALPAAAAAAEPPSEVRRECEVPGFVPPAGATWEERLGPIGIAVGAIVACALAWLLTWKLF